MMMLKLMVASGAHVCPVQVSAPESGVFAAGAHSDYGMLTLLVTDDVQGLQVSTQRLCTHL